MRKPKMPPSMNVFCLASRADTQQHCYHIESEAQAAQITDWVCCWCGTHFLEDHNIPAHGPFQPAVAHA